MLSSAARSARLAGVQRGVRSPSAQRRRAHFTLLAAGDQPLDVLDADEDDERDQEREAGQVDQRLPFGRQSPPPSRLDQHDRDPAAVEGRERQDVENREVEREDAEEM